MVDLSTMPPAISTAPGAESEEQKRYRLAHTMPPAISRTSPSDGGWHEHWDSRSPREIAAPPAQPKPAPDRTVMPPVSSSPAPMRPNASAVGATSQPSFAYGPDKSTTDANARAIPAPAIDRNVMPPIPGTGPNVTPGQPAKPASFGDTAPDRSVMPPVKPSFAQRYEEQAGAEPERKDFPKVEMPFWKKALGMISAGAGGFGRHDNTTYDLARGVLGAPEAKAEKKFGQAHDIWQRGLEAIQKESGLKNTESEISARGNKDETALAKIGMKRGPDGEIIPDENSEIHKGQQAKITQAEETQKSLGELRTAQKQLAEARTEVELAKNDPNSPAFKTAQQKLLMAQRAHDIAAQNLGLHQQQFENKLHEQELVKPSGQSQSRGSAAEAVLNLYDRPGKPGLESLVRKNAAQMGPLIGRINRGEMAIGDLPPDVGELVTAMESFYALQPAVHGFRNVEFVKDFKTAMGYLERDPESFIAGMKGLRPTLESVRDEGKTFHKRVVEGENGAGGGAGKGKWNAKLGKYE